MSEQMRTEKSPGLPSALRKFLVLIVWIALWAIAAWAIGSPVVLASPGETIEAFAQNLLSVEFWLAIGGTLWHVALGSILACVLGCALGIVSARLRLVEDFVGPVMQFIKSAPLVCFVVLLLVWLGSRYVDVAAVVLAVVPLYYFALNEAWHQRSVKLVEMLDVFNVRRRLRFAYFDWPSVYPFFIQSTKAAVGMSWKSGVTAELIGMTFASIGERVYMSKLTLDTASLLMWTIVVVLLGWAFEKLFFLAADRLFRPQTLVYRPEVFRPRSGRASAAMAEEPAALSARGICRSFEGRQVVEGYSYDFAPGSRTCIVGATGSGKTTLMRMLLGLDKPDGGKVVHPRGGVSAVFQETRLLPVLSAADNIVLATGASPERARELIAQLLEPEAADALPSELSGGMSRCVEICRALAAEGSFIIMDEPFTGLDGQIKVKAIALIERELNGRGLIMVTHDRSEAEALRCTFADVADSKAK